jgi:hypothetical protein
VLIVLSSWVSDFVSNRLTWAKHRNQNGAEIRLISDQVISIIFGLVGGFLLLHPPIMGESAEIIQEKLHRSPWELVLFFEVMIVPPIIYESALNMIKRREVLSRIGTLLVSQIVTVLVVLAIFTGFAHLTGIAAPVSNTNMIVILGLAIQLNDYSGTLDPHISFNIEDSSVLSFLSTIAVFKNAILIFILANIMP